MIFFYTLLVSVIFCCIIYLKHFYRAKPIIVETLYEEVIEESVKVGGIYNVGNAETIFFGINKDVYLHAKNITITVLQLNSITLGEWYIKNDQKKLCDDFPTLKNSECHLVLYDCKQFYVPNFYWAAGYVKKFDADSASLLTEHDP